MRVVVAMSGGVDSSTVAALLQEQGHEVIGMTMKLYDQSEDSDEGSCCSLDDVGDAKRVAAKLGIPHYVVNYTNVFSKAVVDDFVASYLRGETPNPCVRCNDVVKFKPLLHKARQLGADFLATGHYAQIRREEGKVSLWRGLDATKDQTYFLAGIKPSALARVLFPLGGMTKEEVRKHAERFDLSVAHKAESMEVCFIPDNDYKSFIEQRSTPQGGSFVSLDGLAIGRHGGIHKFTVGQRKGIGIAAKEPLYVVDVNAETHEVTVGPRSATLAYGLWGDNERWLDKPPPGDEVQVAIRHNQRALLSAQVYQGGRFELHFTEPAQGVSPGQQAAVYRGEQVLGALTIRGRLSDPVS